MAFDGRAHATKHTFLAVRKMVQSITDKHRVVVAVVQFSGEKQLENTYKAGNNGANDGCPVKMYKFEVDPTALDSQS